MKYAKLYDRNPALEKLYSSKNEEDFKDISTYSSKEYIWHCVTCNSEFEKRPELIYNGKTNCTDCVQKAKSRGRSLASVKKYGSIETLPEHMKDEWADETPMEEVSVNSKKRYKWKCSDCGDDYTKVPYGQVMFNGCVPCRRTKVNEEKFSKMAKDRGPLGEHRPDLALEWDYEMNDKKPSDYTQFSTHRVWWKCKKNHGSYKAPISRRNYSGTGCPSCGKESRLENIVGDFLKLIEVDYILNSYPIRDMTPGLPNKSRKLQLDFLIPQYSLAFEVQDFASHSRTSDEDISEFFGHPMKGPVYHENKRVLTKSQLGVTLIDLWEDEIDSGLFKEVIMEAFKNLE